MASELLKRAHAIFLRSDARSLFYVAALPLRVLARNGRRRPVRPRMLGSRLSPLLVFGGRGGNGGGRGLVRRRANSKRQPWRLAQGALQSMLGVWHVEGI